ncbi:MAG: bifunctional nuclease family protein [Paludibacteraceae bacterium]|nr:bifunctional nuclease family protein [Bacteroidales bacterium]MBP3467442.1 bifunctional nuclease family protein [Paludibacteraceae bacterium]MBQ1836258.1 bifunctional nuclease family protein [Paludibacteraceae bacterium]MBQ2050644.1 bifunctional nuclease family protein [Paludibacteraceae bacterium]MBQ3681161.1 bifunctional nuclease family protein [Paludibacteraceae bacterium]
MELSQLYLVGISYSRKIKPFNVMVMGEMGSAKRIPIVIGDSEALSIVNVLTHARLSRPNTHDLMSNILDICGLKLRNVVIYKMENDIFYSRLIISKSNESDKVMLVETRTSDAVALALRQNVPIVATKDVIDAAPEVTDDDLQNLKSGDRDMIMNTDKPAELDQKFLDFTAVGRGSAVKENSLGGLSDEKLRDMIESAIKAENYELASKVKQEMDKRGLS